ncbi:hypothetical protein [Deinococcus cellulosilyticus]|uniref:Uncharacterized protein n=1 Tax=Deinococcus cellulosilyticus (strain DSM 18568 / NBRC 106333 / KACC 11606 / 5516J-15) TaxID=1223518 RepID=A0A511N0I2_DEIC1|nr:hypothetical protein [Deinococcus cellulosilyticus]GEM45896.1 hypothetical protein DC3_15310 [Deinococcus cellulosilyticus NBRC 106333 = KACC 11606]
MSRGGKSRLKSGVNVRIKKGTSKNSPYYPFVDGKEGTVQGVYPLTEHNLPPVYDVVFPNGASLMFYAKELEIIA